MLEQKTLSCRHGGGMEPYSNVSHTYPVSLESVSGGNITQTCLTTLNKDPIGKKSSQQLLSNFSQCAATISRPKAG